MVHVNINHVPPPYGSFNHPINIDSSEEEFSDVSDIDLPERWMSSSEESSSDEDQSDEDQSQNENNQNDSRSDLYDGFDDDGIGFSDDNGQNEVEVVNIRDLIFTDQDTDDDSEDELENMVTITFNNEHLLAENDMVEYNEDDVMEELMIPIYSEVHQEIVLASD